MDSRVTPDRKGPSRRLAAPQRRAEHESTEHARLATRFPAGQGWKKWGRYLSEP